MRPSFFRILSVVIAIITPVFLILASVRILLTPLTLDLEYRAPGFPDDPFGFTLEDRLRYGKLGLNYLVNDQDINFLGDLHFPDGQSAPPESCMWMTDCTRLYNDRELQHMVDVKRTVKGALNVLLVTGAVLGILGVWAWRGDWFREYRQGLRWGGWLTLILIGVVLVLVALLFNVFFETFHSTFFAQGSYLFLWSDTLIRLFPERLWRDAFIFVGALSAVFALLLVVFLRKRKWD